MKTAKSDLVGAIAALIEKSKASVQIYANSTLTLLYWHIGKRINDDVLQNKRAEYGKQIVPLLAVQLTERFGRSYEVRNLRRMMQFAELFPDLEIVSPLVTQLSWSHITEILPLKSAYERTELAKLHALLIQAREQLLINDAVKRCR